MAPDAAARNPYQPPGTPGRPWRTSGTVLTLFVLLTFAGGLGTLSFAWALHRISARVLVHDDAWPRPAPYPDRWLMELNDWYDRRYPAPPNMLKIHGEIGRVQLTLLAGLVPSLLMFLVGAVPLGRNVLIRGSAWLSGPRKGADLPRSRSSH
jgi:hypothetical protein